jgi:hypothetical protein
MRYAWKSPELIPRTQATPNARHASPVNVVRHCAFRANAASMGSFDEAFRTASRAAIAALTAMIKMDTIREDVFTAAGSENP